MSAGPGNFPAFRAGKNQLEQLQVARAKRGDGTGEIQSPRSGGFDSEQLDNFFPRLLESIEPQLESSCVVASQILNIQHREIPRLENGHGLGQGRRVGAWENAFSNPGAERTITKQ